MLSEEDIADKYPWDYDILSTRLMKRYSDFKMNAKYHQIRKELEEDKRYAYLRILNPLNPEGGTKSFSTPILEKIDNHYNKIKA